MLLALTLLAQTAVATPAPVSTPVPIRKFSGGFGKVATAPAGKVVIGPDDVKAAPTPVPEPFVPGLTRAPAPPVGNATAPVQSSALAPSAVDEERLWRDRYAAARSKLVAARAKLAQAERNVGDVVTWNGRHSQAHWIMAQARENTLLPYRLAVDDAQREVESVRSACRVTTGCAPGWVRD